MHRPSFPFLATALALSLAVLCTRASWPQPDDAVRTAPARRMPGAPPAPAVQFVANAGQWPAEVAFAATFGPAATWVTADGFVQRFERHGRDDRVAEGAVVRTRVRGGAGRACGELATATRHTWLRGGRVHVAGGFGRVRLGDVVPGVDLVLRPAADGGGALAYALAYDLELAAGTDLAPVALDCEGVRKLAIAADGALELAVPLPDGGEVLLRQTPPVAWQETPAGRRAVKVSFRLLGQRSYGFQADALDPALPTVIDPGLVWSTLLGGASNDSVQDLEWIENEGIWVGGWAGSTDFPVTAGAYRTTGGRDGFVARLAEDGSTVVWATYLGGSDLEEVRGIAVGPDRSVTAVGFTSSTDFPTVAGAFQPNYAGASVPAGIGDAFVVRLSANGSSLVGGTYLGGGFDDVAEAVVVDAQNHAFVCGWTSSVNFPRTPGVLQPNLSGFANLQTDGFVARVAPDGRSLAWSTYLGGDFPDQLFDIDLDGAGRPTVVGNSLSVNWPVTVSAYRTTPAGELECVATRLAANGTALVWSTYLGGVESDRALDLSVAGDGTTWVCGDTASPNFPTTAGAFQRQRSGATDGYVLRLSGDGSSLLFSSLLGGSGDDAARAIAIGPAGTPFVVGETMGGFPVTAGAPQAVFGGGTLDAFVAEFAPGGGSLAFATYLGGSTDDFLLSARRGASGLAIVGGFTFAVDFPTTSGVLQQQLRGMEDGVVAQYDLDAQLGGSLRLSAGGAVPASAFDPGAVVDALALQLRNDTPRRLLPQSVRIFVGGAGDCRLLTGISIWRDDPARPGTRDSLLDGPRPVPFDNAEVTLDLTGLGALPVGGTVELMVALHTNASVPENAEFACAVLGNDAWSVLAEGAGSGPGVTVTGSARLAGEAFVAIAAAEFSGDDDGDGRITASDLRRLCQRVGQPAGRADPDGDGLITAEDVRQEQAAVLGRAVAQGWPAAVARDEYAAITGWFGAETPTVTLGGRVLPVATATPREIAFRVDGTAPLGSQPLRITFASGHHLERTIVVQ